MRKEKRIVFTHKTVIEAPITDVWPFFADVNNLRKLTRFPKVTIAAVEEEKFEKIVHLTLSFFVIRLRWILCIEKIVAFEKFHDRAIKLPFPLQTWEHEHFFIAEWAKTVMIDTVYCTALIPSFIMKAMLRMMFKSRAKQLQIYNFSSIH